MKRSKTLLLAAIATLALGTFAMAAATAVESADYDAAVSAAKTAARERGEVSVTISSVKRSDAAALRAEGLALPPSAAGDFYVVTMLGRFDAGMAPPGREIARGIFSKMIVYVRDGKVVGGESYP